MKFYELFEDMEKTAGFSAGFIEKALLARAAKIERAGQNVKNLDDWEILRKLINRTDQQRKTVGSVSSESYKLRKGLDSVRDKTDDVIEMVAANNPHMRGRIDKDSGEIISSAAKRSSTSEINSKGKHLFEFSSGTTDDAVLKSREALLNRHEKPNFIMGVQPVPADKALVRYEGPGSGKHLPVLARPTSTSSVTTVAPEVQKVTTGGTTVTPPASAPSVPPKPSVTPTPPKPSVTPTPPKPSVKKDTKKKAKGAIREYWDGLDETSKYLILGGTAGTALLGGAALGMSGKEN